MTVPDWLSIKPAGDRGMFVYCGNEISEAVGARVSAMDAAVKEARIPGVSETVPAFSSLLIRFDPLIIMPDELEAALLPLASRIGSAKLASGRLVEIPVCYGGEYGPDLDGVARISGLAPDEVIRIHCATDYRIYMLGFLPGFPYLGGLDRRICCPRLDSPRTKIPAGSVGIGGEQTGIYPISSPGGWRLIGRTPLVLFDPTGAHETPYSAGDSIRFVPISPVEFQRIERNERCDKSEADI